MEALLPASGSALAYRIRVSLDGIRPEIWRLLDVSGDLTLADLHEIIQIAFGWRLGRSHVFVRSDGRRWSDGRWYGEGGVGDDELTTTLAEALTPRSGRLSYLYDPRAGWKHAVSLVSILAVEPGRSPARLISGARHGPLDDVGGPQGYAELLADLDDAHGPRHASMLRWVNGTLGPWHRSFDSDHLDQASVNHGLSTHFAPEQDRPRARGSQLGALERRVFPGLRREFADFVDRAELDQPVSIADDQAAQMMQALSWLLGVIDGGEVRLSESGRLPTKLGPAMAPAGIQTLTQPGAAFPDLLKATVRWKLARKHGGRLELTQIGRRLLSDPRQLWWHLARHWLPAGRATAAHDASTLLLVELAVGAHVSRHDVADAVAFGLDSLGWVDPVNHASIYEDLVWSLVASDRRMLRALGVISNGSADEPLATGPQARAFARAALQVQDEAAGGSAMATDGGPWRHRPTSSPRRAAQRGLTDG
ncbi:MAG: plasmid pRiA4b ORF-3 family protein [Propionibacteriaceae bacterium]